MTASPPEILLFSGWDLYFKRTAIGHYDLARQADAAELAKQDRITPQEYRLSP